ncbi:MAG TPA: hypothetical protein DFS52_12210 [Myxococcales bacterium]|nr:hypothetical protein [Myxococcales bacterium]
MARRHGDRRQGQPAATDWESERTLAPAESEAEAGFEEAGDTRCICGADEFLLEAYLQVVAGKPVPQPVEVETLTCPQCGREFEAIATEDGRVLRGDFLGQVELD